MRNVLLFLLLGSLMLGTATALAAEGRPVIDRAEMLKALGDRGRPGTHRDR